MRNSSSSYMLKRKRIRLIHDHPSTLKIYHQRKAVKNCPSNAETNQNSPVIDLIRKSFSQKCVEMCRKVRFRFPASISYREDFNTSIKNIEALQKEIQESKDVTYCSEKVLEQKNVEVAGELKRLNKSPQQTGKSGKKRKYSLDSFHKKIKRNFFNFVLNNQVKLFHVSPKKKQQKDISDVSIANVREFLSQTIEQFISKYCNIDRENGLNPKQNGLKINIEERLNCKLQDYFSEFLQSQEFGKFLNSNLRKEKQRYMDSLNSYAMEFVSYFFNTKDLKRKK